MSFLIQGDPMNHEYDPFILGLCCGISAATALFLLLVILMALGASK